MPGHRRKDWRFGGGFLPRASQQIAGARHDPILVDADKLRQSRRIASVRSVFRRSTSTGTPKLGASSCKPPESVSTRLARDRR